MKRRAFLQLLVALSVIQRPDLLAASELPPQKRQLFVGLHTAPNQEVNAPDYERQPLDPFEQWKDNQTTIYFPTTTSDWGTITAAVIYSPGGKKLHESPLYVIKTLWAGDTFQLHIDLNGEVPPCLEL